MEQSLALQQEKFEQLIKAYKNFKKSPKERITTSYVETKLECLETLFAEFKKGHNEIISVAIGETKSKIQYFKDDTYGEFEEYYVMYKSILKDASRSLTKDGDSLPASSSATSSYEIKLPRIQLPVFTGKYQEWQTFYDMFVSLIHNNPNLSLVQKLHYLKGSLSGEPENLLRNLSTTELNYAEAWKQLTKRYNNKRYNCNAIMKSLFGQKQIHGESASAIRQLLDTTSSALKSLNNIGVETKSWDTIILYLVVSKLDPESHRQWEIKVSESSADDLPTWSQLTDFLESRFRTLEMIDAAKTTTKPFAIPIKPIVKPKSFHSSLQNEKSRTVINCTLCSGQHYLFQCKEFGKKTPHERQDFVQTNRLCFNCLAPSHAVKQCHQSTSCRKCSRRHHSLLHFDKTEIMGITNDVSNTGTSKFEMQHQHQPQNVASEMNIVANHSREDISPCNVLLATAKIRASSRDGYKRIIRALIDQGSQACFVTEETVQLLGLKKIRIDGTVSGIGDGQMDIKHKVKIIIESCRDPSYIIQLQAYVLNHLTSMLPTKNVNKLDWLQFEELSLADPGFSTPGRIDILLGADVYCEILLEGMRKSPRGNLIAQNTTLGWILSGKTSNESTSVDVINMHVQIREDNLLKKFWEIEAEPNGIEKRLTKQEKTCEELYDLTTKRDKEGRFVVKLPFESDDPECQYGKLRQISEKRYNLLERKLSKDPKLREDYQNVLREYIKLNHMEMIIEEEEKSEPTAVYLPHHAVVREDKDTTKVRIVFDASCKGVNDVSLNDNLLVGPKLQDDLRHILMRWRCHKIAIVADIIKMYRQVRVDDADTKFQRILWKPDPNNEVQHFKMLTLTFGTASAPYLAVKSLQRLAEDEIAKYPLATSITKRDFYIDDLMTGCNSKNEAVQIVDEMNGLMNAGGFQLQKWSSNDDAMLKYIGDEKLDENKALPIKIDNLVKVLGINWNRCTDNFEYNVNLPVLNEPVTKRKVLSDIARLYDPMGWIAPIVITGKIFIQKLWRSGLLWDECLPQDLMSEWLKYRENLYSIQGVSVPRWMSVAPECINELHAFSDASQAAYSAVLYIRSIDQFGNVNVSLVTAKTKVAPIEKEVSIPRLELCGAVLAAKLLHEVAQVMTIPKENLHAWTDSTVVLAWLRGLPCRWTTFVSNRVSDILTILEYEQWSHVSTTSNPADCASRGMQPTELLNHASWWKGPDWLSKPTVERYETDYDTQEESRPVKSLAVIDKTKEFLWSKFSNLSRMLGVLSYCRRFLRLKRPKEERPILQAFVTHEERNQTLLMCIKQIQESEFEDDIKQLRSGKPVAKKSPLHTLYPFLENGIIRVGGRIHLANVKYDKKHPIVLPAKSQLTTMIIADAHERTLHGGPQIMLNYLRGKYWILRVRERVKKHYKNCVTCLRYSKIHSTQLMGQIPEYRLKPSKPFRSAGVDYAGPIQIRCAPGRGAKSYKGYICLFVCMVTHAIHLEAVSDLTAKGFISAFRRFTSRRGHCKYIFSDNGTNFVGAEKQLREMFHSAIQSEIAQLLSMEGVTWHFIPPHAPNFGGLWESGVRSTKNHLRKVIGESALTFEELSTVLTQIEACLNSRPLSKLSDCPEDPMPLTPGHYLVGEPLINIPDENCADHHITGLERWKLTQKIVGDFWKKWSKEYLVELSQRYKWSTKKSEPDVNDVVILREDNVPPARWVLGRVVEKHTGKDNITRVVTVKCKNNTLLKRPTNKLIVLPK